LTYFIEVEESFFDLIHSERVAVFFMGGFNGFWQIECELSLRLHSHGGLWLICYHSGWRARTNDVWRQEILESKGWSILRVWSTDWFDKPEITQKQLLEKLDALRAIEQNVDNTPSYSFINRPSEKVGLSSDEVSEKSASEFIDTAKNTTSNSNNIAIEVGDTVRYEFVDSGTVAEVKLVNGGNVASGSININTPLARAMIDSGAGEGDLVIFLSPTGKKELRIIAIQKPTFWISYSHSIVAGGLPEMS
jgi:hypothetical protein